MKKVLPLLILCQVILLGCGPSLSTIQSTNRINLNKISLGMTKKEVLDIMGTTTIKIGDGSLLSSPYRSETLFENGKNYEIHFFYTDLKKEDGVITDDELTPVVYFEGKVCGYGWFYLKDNIKKYQISIK